MAQTQIRIDNAAVARMLNSSSGPVSRDLEKRGRKVATRARQLAPGSMKRKISVDLESGHVRVSCSHPATLFVVRKTQPHAIRPNPPHKRLRFKGKNGITFTKFVWHPGNRHPNNFLLRAMREAS
jgi:hypothetical protein